MHNHPFSYDRAGSEPPIPGNPEVEALLASAIAEKGMITFAEYMDICLFSDGGYYNSGFAEISGDGSQSADFMTSPEAHPVFGAALATKAHGMWREMGRPPSFSIVEMGAGNGSLARGVLKELQHSFPDLASAVDYSIIEQSAPLIERQQSVLRGLPVNWHQGTALSLPLSRITGVLLSNELPDAFPVHRFVRRGRSVKEVYTTMDAYGNLTDIEEDPSIIPDGHFNPPEGAEFTYCPALEPWVRSMAAALERGYTLTIDYGITGPESLAPRVYSRLLQERNGEQTLTGKYQMPGLADITASVDFERLARLGEAAGLQTRLLTSQKEFLTQNNYQQLLARMISDTADRGIAASTHYFAAYPLISEEHMGGFKVLIQSKNVG